MDVTHPHLFEEGIIFFVLCHLYGLTKVRERRKRWVYILSFSALLLDTGMPWLTRFVSPVFGTAHMVSSLFLTVMFAILIIGPMYEMWWDFDREEKYDWARYD